jgi:cytoskeletal protein CcmA (bactofilin family)
MLGLEPRSGAADVASETFLDAGSVLAGELRFAGSVRLEGSVEGQVQAGKRVIVGEGAQVDATIEAETLEVYGTVVGDIRVTRQTVLHKTAHVEGEIQTAGIVVEEGARFKGCIVIGPEKSEFGPKPALPDVPPLAAVRPDPMNTKAPER